MQHRVFNYLRAFCLMLGCALTVFDSAAGQSAAGHIRAWPAPERRFAVQATQPAEDKIQTMLSLNLCVDGSATYPCAQSSADSVYVSKITLTYGQILDGYVVYGAVDGTSPTSGTITLYKTTPSATVAVCILTIGVENVCPPDSTIFDAGNYTLTATLTFPAGSMYADSSALPVTILIAQDPTSIALTSSANPAALGTAVTFTAIVSGSYPAVPTGQAVFTVDGTAFPALPLDATGAATITLSTLDLGAHRITADYAGATDFLPAEEATLMQQIVPPPTTTTIASSLNPSTIGESVTFTATVSTAAGLGVTPGDRVTFKDGTASISTVPLASSGSQNVAQTSISTLVSGTHNITAIYPGNAATSASVSPVLVQQVNYPLTMAPPGYRITVTPAALSVFAGTSADLNVTVTPVTGFSGAVALSCSNLPNETACTFGEATIPAGGGSTTLTLTTMFPHDCGSKLPYGGFGSGAGLLFLFLPRRRACRRSLRMTALLALTALGFLFPLGGCGSRCTDFGTTPGSYTFKVNGSAAASPASNGGVSAAVALSVKP